jgi:hypothetical protein
MTKRNGEKPLENRNSRPGIFWVTDYGVSVNVYEDEKGSYIFREGKKTYVKRQGYVWVRKEK